MFKNTILAISIFLLSDFIWASWEEEWESIRGQVGAAMRSDSDLKRELDGCNEYWNPKLEKAFADINLDLIPQIDAEKHECLIRAYRQHERRVQSSQSTSDLKGESDSGNSPTNTSTSHISKYPGAIIMGLAGNPYPSFASALGKDITEADRNWNSYCSQYNSQGGCHTVFVRCDTGGWFSIVAGNSHSGYSCGWDSRDAALIAAVKELQNKGDYNPTDCRVGFVDGRSHTPQGVDNLIPTMHTANYSELDDCMRILNSIK